MRIEESLNVTFDESLPEPKSSSLIEDDRIDEPMVQDLNGSSSLQVNVSDEGYPKSIKEARGHPIKQVIGEGREREHLGLRLNKLRIFRMTFFKVQLRVLPNNQVSSLKSVLYNKALENSSSNSDIDEDWYNVEDNINDVVIPQITIEEDRTWDKIGNPLIPNNIGNGYSICCENTMNMINSVEDLKEDTRNMLSSINEGIKLMLAITINMSRVIKTYIEKEKSKDNHNDQEHIEGNALDPWILAVRSLRGRKILGGMHENVMNCKIDLLAQEYEKFSISNEETIDSGFTRFNAIGAKVTTIEEAKDLATLPLDELIGNLKVYEMVLDNDGVASKTTKEKVKTFALKAKVTREQTSDDSDSQDGSDDNNDEGEGEAFNLLARKFCRFFRKGNRFRCGNRFRNGAKSNRSVKAVVIALGIKSDSDDGDEPQDDATYIMAFESQEVVSKPSSSNSDLNIIDLQKENEELLKFNREFTKTFEKLLKEKRALEDKNSKLSSKINDLELEVKKLVNNKEVVEPCQKCVELTQKVDSLKSNVSKLHDESLNLSKFKSSSIALDDMSGVTARIPEKLIRKRIPRKRNFGANHKGTANTSRKEIQGQTKEGGEPEDTVQPPPSPPEKDTQIDEKIEGKDKHPKRPLESKPPKKMVIHDDYPDQTITIGGNLSVKCRSELIEILRKHADAFAWTPADMTGIPHFIA
ncbi:hypothetical protein Tco_0184146 [Tanacetum coccineum]